MASSKIGLGCIFRFGYRRGLFLKNSVRFDRNTCSWSPKSAAIYNGLHPRFCALSAHASQSYRVSTTMSRNGLCARLYSSASSKNSDVKGLADQILKEKIEDMKQKTSTSDGKSTGDGSSTTGDQQSSESVGGAGFSKRAMKYTFVAFGAIFTGLGGYLLYEWGQPLRDKDGNVIPDEFSDLPTWKAYIYRTFREVKYYDKMIKDPSREKLLPDPLTEPYVQPPYTLVMEITGVLLHPEWTYRTGWRFKKRPGVDFLLQQAGPPLFEIVIYTSEQGFTAFPLIDSLDRQGYIMYRLFRDATRYMDGHHVKDLSCLNRDLSKVIYIDWNEKSYQLQPRNALKLKKWSGNDDDRTLFDLAIFLRTIGTSGVDDVRIVLDHYNQFDDPLEAFKENQRKLLEEQERLAKQQQEEKKKQPLAKQWSGGLGGVFSRR